MDTTKAKSVVKKTLENSLEFVKPLGQLGSADAAASQLTGHKIAEIQPSGKSDVGDYLKNLSDTPLTPEQVAAKKQQDDVKIQDFRKALDPQTGIASHLRIPDLRNHRDPKKGRYFEMIKEQEEAEKVKQMQQGGKEFVVPTSKPARGSLSGKIKRQESSMETKQSRKTQ
jgi:hypothetical protein